MSRTLENDQSPPKKPGRLIAMMKIIAGFILLLVPFSTIAEACEISGKAILWAYDVCFWQHETDDSLHPGVIDCVEEGEQVIARVGTCEAKQVFKSRMCDMAIRFH